MLSKSLVKREDIAILMAVKEEETVKRGRFAKEGPYASHLLTQQSLVHQGHSKSKLDTTRARTTELDSASELINSARLVRSPILIS